MRNYILFRIWPVAPEIREPLLCRSDDQALLIAAERLPRAPVIELWQEARLVAHWVSPAGMNSPPIRQPFIGMPIAWRN